MYARKLYIYPYEHLRHSELTYFEIDEVIIGVPCVHLRNFQGIDPTYLFSVVV